MPSPSESTTTGKVIAVNDGQVVFQPRQTNYELHLRTAGQYTGAVNAPVDVTIRAAARKVWTVPSGGNFIVPIVGTPRIVQGRVKWIGDGQLIVHAGAKFLIDLPAADTAIDLPNGAIAVGTMVNVTVLPGAAIEPASADPSPQALAAASGAPVVASASAAEPSGVR